MSSHPCLGALIYYGWIPFLLQVAKVTQIHRPKNQRLLNKSGPMPNRQGSGLYLPNPSQGLCGPLQCQVLNPTVGLCLYPVGMQDSRDGRSHEARVVHPPSPRSLSRAESLTVGLTCTEDSIHCKSSSFYCVQSRPAFSRRLECPDRSRLWCQKGLQSASQGGKDVHEAEFEIKQVNLIVK